MRAALALALSLALVACGGSLGSAKSEFHKGRLAEAKSELAALEADSRTWLYLSQGKKIEYIRAFLYRVANNLIVDGSRKKQSSSLGAHGRRWFRGQG